jgi:D-sedoheptulose 7-phosphate isomerase
MPELWNEMLREHTQVLTDMAAAGPMLAEIADALIAALRENHRVYVIGNGGSAADAQHIAAEFLGRFRLERRALPVLALTTDTSTLTAIANDTAYERVFARQLEGLLNSGDVLWALSTSGDSPNVVAAAELATQRKALTIGFTGAGGGRLARHCRLLLRVPHTRSDRIQEAHQLAYHYICARVEQAFA